MCVCVRERERERERERASVTEKIRYISKLLAHVKQSLKVYENNRDIKACLIYFVTAEEVIQTPSTVNIPTMPWRMERFSERL